MFLGATGLTLGGNIGCSNDVEHPPSSASIAGGGTEPTLLTGGVTASSLGTGGQKKGGGGSKNDTGGSSADSGSSSSVAIEPPGPDTLILVQGAVDAPRVFFCWAKIALDGKISAMGRPVPESGLGYGEAWIPTEITNFDRQSESLVPLAMASDSLPTMDCAAALGRAQQPEAAGAVSGESDVRVTALPALPASTLTRGRAYLLTLRGCFGGRVPLNDSHAEALCGAGYADGRTTLSAHLVSPSRLVRSNQVGLQVAYEAVWEQDATTSLKVVVQEPDQSPRVLIGSVSPGQLTRPTFLDLATFGADQGESRVQITGTSGTSIAEEQWSALLARAKLTSLASNHAYDLVLVGPSLSRVWETTPYNPPAMVLVDATSAP